MSHFGREFFSDNRARLRELFAGTAPIIITANSLLQRSRDTHFPFRQDSNFWYLTGVNEPDAWLVIERDRETLVFPESNARRDLFDGALDVQAIKDRSGIEEILIGRNKKLSTRLKRVKHIATLPEQKKLYEYYGIVPNPARQKLAEMIRNINPDVEFLDINKHLESMRSVKQPEEIKAIRHAIKVTGKAFKRVEKRLEKYNTESEVASDITAIFGKEGSGHAYQPIVASGANACTLHYTTNSGDLDKKDALLIDAGAEVENYAADITRTFLPPRASKRQKDVVKTVEKLQGLAFDLLEPGITLKGYEDRMVKYAGEELRSLGLVDVISEDSVREYYPHATSHFLGLDVHDVGDSDQPLRSGMVLTVEPGIYIPEEKIGVRIEDNVLITDAGLKILSKGV